MNNITFGTDGWRGIISEDFTFSNVRIVAQAIADYVKAQGAGGRGQSLIVGYDTRFLSDEFARTISEVFAGNGVKVLLATRPTPTPAVSFTIKDRKLNGGVIVTASHNPPKYSGIKFKADYGGPADPLITKKIEGLLGKRKVNLMPYLQAQEKGLIRRYDLDPGYLGLLKKYLDLDLLRKKRYSILVDVMHGVGNGYVAQALEGARSNVEIIHNDRNPTFLGIPPEPIEKNLKELIGRMKNGRYDIGLAIDGDADRIGAVRPDGHFISSGEIIALLALHFYEDKGWRGAIAKTISVTSLIDKIARKYNLKLHETPVGFKHICKLMLDENILIGGEESGGIGFMNYPPERDGTLAGLLLLEMMAYRNRSITQIMSEMEREFGRHYYFREDLEYPDELKNRLFARLDKNPPKELAGVKIVERKDYDGRKFIARDGSWALFRLSGTEPILRIYVEAFSAARARKLMNFARKIAFAA